MNKTEIHHEFEVFWWRILWAPNASGVVKWWFLMIILSKKKIKWDDFIVTDGPPFIITIHHPPSAIHNLWKFMQRVKIFIKMKTLYHHSKEINAQFEWMINTIHLQVLQVNVSITEGKILKQQFIGLWIQVSVLKQVKQRVWSISWLTIDRWILCSIERFDVFFFNSKTKETKPPFGSVKIYWLFPIEKLYTIYFEKKLSVAPK